MLYEFSQYFLVEKGLMSNEKYTELKKELVTKTTDQDKTNIHIDFKLQTPKLIYSERYIDPEEEK